MFSLNSFIMKVLEIGIATNKSMIKYIVFLSLEPMQEFGQSEVHAGPGLDSADLYI